MSGLRILPDSGIPDGQNKSERTDGSTSGQTERPARDKFGQRKPHSNALLRNLLHFFTFLCMDLSFLTAPAEHSLHAWTDLRPVLPDLQIRRQPRSRHLSRPGQTPEWLLFRSSITSPGSEGNFHFGSAIHLRGQNAVQMHRRPVGVEGGRKKCPPSTRIGPLHARMPFGPRRWIAERPVPADLEIRMICANRRSSSGQQELGSEMFCETGPAAACVTDYPEHIAPRSPQKHRPVSAILSEQIFNQHFKLAQCSQVASKTQIWEQ